MNGPKIDYYNVGNVGWAGVNGLIEYNDSDKLTAVVQAGFSNQSFQREDYFDQAENPISETANLALSLYSIKPLTPAQPTLPTL